ncbi:hypothetical protein [Oceanobacillus alkalisoli]|uniref:hypothetical protein n=1 Tax=Oceanobacillus alkalisoli TaxID=2925113 RepID=UPI001F11EE91|nr:hypothetical protein [Oceanobacillus alkalisoli]MCF3944397.1 hypothetical protein [Oceanobacillus alkalisoli]
MRVWLAIYFTFYGCGLTPEIGVVDRMEEDKAVILLEKTGEELIIDKKSRRMMVHENNWLLLVRLNNTPVILAELAGQADRQQKKSHALIEELRERSPLFHHRSNRTSVCSFIQKYWLIR